MCVFLCDLYGWTGGQWSSGCGSQGGGVKEFTERKTETAGWMKEGRIRKEAHKGDVPRGSIVHLKSGAVSFNPPPPRIGLLVGCLLGPNGRRAHVRTPSTSFVAT
jgi:hypothetical protein